MPLILVFLLSLFLTTAHANANSQECVYNDNIRTCKTCDTEGHSCLTYKQQNGKVIITVENLIHAPHSFFIDLMLKNLKPENPIPDAFTLKGKGAKREFVIVPANKHGPFSYNINYKSNMGRFDAQHNNAYIYALPFAPGTTETVTQGNFSDGSHKNKYATDFGLKVGTPLFASREGEVIKVRENSTASGNSKEYHNSANHIYVEHDDGTIATYVHLQPNGSIVQEGDYVRRGQRIGYSGNTGMSSGPHLHFEVRATNREGKTITFPTKFQSANGIIDEVTKGMKLTATQ